LERVDLFLEWASLNFFDSLLVIANATAHLLKAILKAMRSFSNNNKLSMYELMVLSTALLDGCQCKFDKVALGCLQMLISLKEYCPTVDDYLAILLRGIPIFKKNGPARFELLKGLSETLQTTIAAHQLVLVVADEQKQQQQQRVDNIAIRFTKEFTVIFDCLDDCLLVSEMAKSVLVQLTNLFGMEFLSAGTSTTTLPLHSKDFFDSLLRSAKNRREMDKIEESLPSSSTVGVGAMGNKTTLLFPNSRPYVEQHISVSHSQHQDDVIAVDQDTAASAANDIARVINSTAASKVVVDETESFGVGGNSVVETLTVLNAGQNVNLDGENELLSSLRCVDATKLSVFELETTLNSLKQVISIFQQCPENTSLIINHLKETVQHLTISYFSAFTLKELHFKLCKYTLSSLLVLFGNAQIVELVDADDLECLLDRVYIVLLDEAVTRLQDGNQLYKGNKTLLNAIMENSNRTRVLSALIKLLGKGTKNEVHQKYFELLVKCLLKLTKDFSRDLSNVDVDILLRDLHEFFSAYPASYFKGGKSDLPLRILKTVLNELVNIKGPNIRAHLSLIPTHKNPLIVSFIDAMLKNPAETPTKRPKASLRPSNNNNSNSGGYSSASKAVQFDHHHEQQRQQGNKIDFDKDLQLIIDNVIDCKLSNSSIYRLYRFTQDHPQVDIDAYLQTNCKSLSTELKDNIKLQLERLKKIEIENSSIAFTQQQQQQQQAHHNLTKTTNVQRQEKIAMTATTNSSNTLMIPLHQKLSRISLAATDNNKGTTMTTTTTTAAAGVLNDSSNEIMRQKILALRSSLLNSSNNNNTNNQQ